VEVSGVKLYRTDVSVWAQEMHTTKMYSPVRNGCLCIISTGGKGWNVSRYSPQFGHRRCTQLRERKRKLLGIKECNGNARNGVMNGSKNEGVY